MKDLTEKQWETFTDLLKKVVNLEVGSGTARERSTHLKQKLEEHDADGDAGEFTALYESS